MTLCTRVRVTLCAARRAQVVATALGKAMYDYPLSHQVRHKIQQIAAKNTTNVCKQITANGSSISARGARTSEG